MASIIALFNHKGGVSKTTTTFHLGWMLARLQKRVLLVDADPQCNLTGMVLGYDGPTALQRFYEEHPGSNLRAGLTPAFESRPVPLQPVPCLPVPRRDRLFLLPGHIGLAEYDVTLGIAQELSGTITALQNVPGSISHLLRLSADAVNADYVLVDMSPSLSSMNQNLLVSSDFFLVPTAPDFYSLMAIDSLVTVLPNWQRWAGAAFSRDELRTADYPFPQPHTKFLGTIIQRFRQRQGDPTKDFRQKIEEIEARTQTRLAPTLEGAGMLLPAATYQRAHVPASYTLAKIGDFNSPIAISQREATPVFALTDEQLGRHGFALALTRESLEIFRTIFRELAQKVITLTDAAQGD